MTVELGVLVALNKLRKTSTCSNLKSYKIKKYFIIYLQYTVGDCLEVQFGRDVHDQVHYHVPFVYDVIITCYVISDVIVEIVKVGPLVLGYPSRLQNFLKLLILALKNKFNIFV